LERRSLAGRARDNRCPCSASGYPPAFIRLSKPTIHTRYAAMHSDPPFSRNAFINATTYLGVTSFHWNSARVVRELWSSPRPESFLFTFVRYDNKTKCLENGLFP
jgi:hypothetical protein